MQSQSGRYHFNAMIGSTDSIDIIDRTSELTQANIEIESLKSQLQALTLDFEKQQKILEASNARNQALELENSDLKLKVETLTELMCHVVIEARDNAIVEPVDAPAYM